VAEALAHLLDATDLLDLAGDRSYARGVAYADDGRVAVREISAQKVNASVRGSEAYRVELAATQGRLVWSCNCPVGLNGDCCKHVVATAVTVSRDGNAATTAAPASTELECYLDSLGRDELAAIVLDQAARDSRLHDRLTARAAARAGAELDEAAWRKRVDAAFRRPGRFVDYRDAPDWARGVYDLLESLHDLLDAGHAAAVVSLAERCHKKCEASVNYVDDSDGWITDIFGRVGDLHHRACVMSSPSPLPFARRLAKLELGAELDTFHRAAARYAEVLGAKGLAEYRQIVEPRWEVLDADDVWSHDSFRLREAMVGVALASGDPDELIRVKQRDLRSPHDYEEIVVFLRSAGRVDEAVLWARNGLSQFRERNLQLRGLQDLLADLLHQQGASADAVELFADAFAAKPSIDGYLRLEREAERTGVADARRAWAFGVVRADPKFAEVLISMLLHVGEFDEAWLVATVEGCNQRLWLELARVREQRDPIGVIPVFVVEMQAAIDSKTKAGYRSAVKTLAHVRELAVTGGAPEWFDETLATVRVEHRAKRTLMDLLDQRGW
jgi:uncharacterized Zn finger protein